MSEKITRQQFMDFFRSEDFHNEMTPDDCAEIFVGVFHGSSDITKEILEELCENYGLSLEDIFYSGKDLNNVVTVAEILYREKNPKSTMNTPSFIYETVEKWNIEYLLSGSVLTLYAWIKENKC